jgi:hypothetical protein
METVTAKRTASGGTTAETTPRTHAICSILKQLIGLFLGDGSIGKRLFDCALVGCLHGIL